MIIIAGRRHKSYLLNASLFYECLTRGIILKVMGNMLLEEEINVQEKMFSSKQACVTSASGN